MVRPVPTASASLRRREEPRPTAGRDGESVTPGAKLGVDVRRRVVGLDGRRADDADGRRAAFDRK
jgi:hypothetical protein